MLFAFLITISASITSIAQTIKIDHDESARRITFGNEKLTLTFNYTLTAAISRLIVNGQDVISGEAGIYSMIRTKDSRYSTLHLQSNPTVKVSGNTITVDGIAYGDSNLSIMETWTFNITNTEIRFDIARKTSKDIVAEEISSPVFIFDSINTWEGAYQDYGGLAWFYLFNKQRDTYGVYSKTSEFWNSKTGNGLTISVTAPKDHVTMKYTRTENDQLAYTVSPTSTEMQLRFDADTKRRRYVRDTTDVWAPINIPAGTSNQSIVLSHFNFEEKFGRGNLKGINQQQVSSVLNTIARIGVIGKKHFGGNSWHTPYGPDLLARTIHRTDGSRHQ